MGRSSTQRWWRLPKQRNTDDEKADIKAGKIPDSWKDKPAKLRQKDRDARWTVKFSKAKVDEEGKQHKHDIAVSVFGYKTMPQSISGMASSAAGPSRMPPPMTVHNSATW